MRKTYKENKMTRKIDRCKKPMTKNLSVRQCPIRCMSYRHTTDSIIRYNVGHINIKLCKKTFAENFPQMWPLSCIFPLLTGVGCLPLTLKKPWHARRFSFILDYAVLCQA